MQGVSPACPQTLGEARKSWHCRGERWPYSHTIFLTPVVYDADIHRVYRQCYVRTSFEQVQFPRANRLGRRCALQTETSTRANRIGRRDTDKSLVLSRANHLEHRCALQDRRMGVRVPDERKNTSSGTPHR